MSHYSTVKFPSRYLNDEVKGIFASLYNIDGLELVDQYINTTQDGEICEFEMDESRIHDDIANALNAINVPAVVYCGSDYDYDPYYFLSYPKGDPVYPNGAVVEICCNNDGTPIVDTAAVVKKMSSILNNLDARDVVRDLRDFRDELQALNFYENKLEDKLLGYYSHETEVGRNKDVSAKIDEVLNRLDNGELDTTEAMKLIKQIREEDSKCAVQSA